MRASWFIFIVLISRIRIIVMSFGEVLAGRLAGKQACQRDKAAMRLRVGIRV